MDDAGVSTTTLMNAASRLLYTTNVLKRIQDERPGDNAAFSKTKANITAILRPVRGDGRRHDPDPRLARPGEPDERLRRSRSSPARPTTSASTPAAPKDGIPAGRRIGLMVLAAATQDAVVVSWTSRAAFVHAADDLGWGAALSLANGRRGRARVRRFPRPWR